MVEGTSSSSAATDFLNILSKPIGIEFRPTPSNIGMASNGSLDTATAAVSVGQRYGELIRLDLWRNAELS